MTCRKCSVPRALHSNLFSRNHPHQPFQPSHSHVLKCSTPAKEICFQNSISYLVSLRCPHAFSGSLPLSFYSDTLYSSFKTWLYSHFFSKVSPYYAAPLCFFLWTSTMPIITRLLINIISWLISGGRWTKGWTDRRIDQNIRYLSAFSGYRQT